MVRITVRGFFLAFFLGVLFLPSYASAIYAYTQDDVNMALSGFVGTGGWAAKYPGTGLYEENSQAGWFGDFRLLADYVDDESLSAKVNLLENVRKTPQTIFPSTGALKRDVERSALFYWQQHDSANTEAALVLDAAYVKYGNWNNEVTFGRQPISTTVTFFFTPNDFFAPFSANTFFRVYKPGVDAIRYEHKLKALSQLSVIGVLGYDTDFHSDSGWSNSPEWEKSSVLARITYTVGLFELGGLGGIVRETAVTGFSLQGELFDWLGIRTEGHYANSWSDTYESGLMTTLSLEHRYPSSLTVRIEYMFNGNGNESIEEAMAKISQGVSRQPYLGRHYTALDLTYEITPLLFGEMLFLRNWSDDSFTMSFNAVYSVSDESDLAVTLSLPGGEEPEEGTIQSELGSLPVQFSVEYRHFF